MSECSICGCDFDLETEGGIEGDLGIIPVSFCPTCNCGVVDYVKQCYPCECEDEDE